MSSNKALTQDLTDPACHSAINKVYLGLEAVCLVTGLCIVAFVLFHACLMKKNAFEVEIKNVLPCHKEALRSLRSLTSQTTDFSTDYSFHLQYISGTQHEIIFKGQ